jgi:1-acyl-sn-glycerol-3-phosphate acyltransferase
VRRRLPGPVHTLYEYFALVFGLLVFGVLSLAWSVAAIVLHVVLPEARARRVGKWGISTGFRIFARALTLIRAYRIDVSALDALRDAPPMIIAPNHPGLLDAVMVISRLPVTCIMKAELENNFFLGAGARLAGYIGNESIYRMIDRSIIALQQGDSLLVFPEGTRTTRSPTNPFACSIGIIARRAAVPVQTVFIDTDSPYLSKGWHLLRRPSFPITYRVRLGKRFDPPERARVLVSEIEQYFATELAGGTLMRSWLPARQSAVTDGVLVDCPRSFPDTHGQSVAHPSHPYS